MIRKLLFCVLACVLFTSCHPALLRFNEGIYDVYHVTKNFDMHVRGRAIYDTYSVFFEINNVKCKDTLFLDSV